MKVLVLNYEFPPLGGGAAPVSRDLAIALGKLGHEVHVITMGFSELPDYVELEGGVKLYRIKCLRKHKSSCSPVEQFSYLISLIVFMKKHTELHDCDVCHTHFVIPTGEGARWVKVLFGIPYIITAHGSDVEGHNTKLSMRIMHKILRCGWRKIVRQSEGVISPSVYLKSLMQNNYSKGVYYHIPNGIDYELYSELAARSKRKQILIMGRLQRFKNVQFVLSALAKVEIDGWKTLVLGDGPYRNELERQVEKIGLRSVEFLGWIDNKSPEQLGIIGESYIYISASQFENCPMSVVETTVAGCYPLLSDIPAHRQLIADSKYYFELNDVDSLVNRLQKQMLLYDGNNISDLPNMSLYCWDNIGKEYEKLLQSIVKKQIDDKE